MSERVVLSTAKGANAGPHKGWVMGPFMPLHSLAHTPGFEVKTWRYDSNPDYGVKPYDGTELIVVYGGTLQLEVTFEDGSAETFVLRGDNHEYIILPAHKKTVGAIKCPTFGITVRWK